MSSNGQGAVTATAEQAGALGTLEHDALFYANDDEYVSRRLRLRP